MFISSLYRKYCLNDFLLMIDLIYWLELESFVPIDLKYAA